MTAHIRQRTSISIFASSGQTFADNRTITIRPLVRLIGAG